MKKKHLLSILACAIIGATVLISCKKDLTRLNQPEAEMQNENSQARLEYYSFLHISNNILEFDSISSYEKVIDIWDDGQKKELMDSLDAVSNYTYFNTNYVQPDLPADTMYSSEFFRRILNNDRIV